MTKIKMEHVKNAVCVGIKYAIYGAMIVGMVKPRLETSGIIPVKCDANYGDAVNEIMQSNMYSHDKTKAISALRKNGGTELYRAVISIVRSRAYSHDKVKMITDISMTGGES